jgi:histone H4
MSGKGGKEGAKRHRQVTKDNIKGVTKPAIRRLARRAGVKRISGSVYDEIRKDHKDRGPLQHFLRTIVQDAVTLTQHTRANTVSTNAVIRSLRRNKKPIVGYGGDSPPATPGRRKRKRPEPESEEEPEEEKGNGNDEAKQEEEQTE